MALDVLNSFKTKGRKILITPGYAELGELQSAEHESLGFHAGKVCDSIILIGNELRTSQIKKGIIESEFDTSQIYCYNSLSSAKQFLGDFLIEGDIVLFENDLPDNYL